MIDRQLDAVARDDRELLEAAAVAGAEFAVPVVAAAVAGTPDAVEARFVALARRAQLVEAAGSSRWPDGTLAARFRFRHALHQTVVYDRVPPGRRERLHLRVAERLETGHRGRTGEVATRAGRPLRAGRRSWSRRRVPRQGGPTRPSPSGARRGGTGVREGARARRDAAAERRPRCGAPHPGARGRERAPAGARLRQPRRRRSARARPPPRRGSRRRAGAAPGAGGPLRLQPHPLSSRRGAGRRGAHPGPRQPPPGARAAAHGGHVRGHDALSGGRVHRGARTARGRAGSPRRAAARLADRLRGDGPEPPRMHARAPRLPRPGPADRCPRTRPRPRGRPIRRGRGRVLLRGARRDPARARGSRARRSGRHRDHGDPRLPAVAAAVARRARLGGRGRAPRRRRRRARRARAWLGSTTSASSATVRST